MSKLLNTLFIPDLANIVIGYLAPSGYKIHQRKCDVITDFNMIKRDIASLQKKYVNHKIQDNPKFILYSFLIYNIDLKRGETISRETHHTPEKLILLKKLTECIKPN